MLVTDIAFCLLRRLKVGGFRSKKTAEGRLLRFSKARVIPEQ